MRRGASLSAGLRQAAARGPERRGGGFRGRRWRVRWRREEGRTQGKCLFCE